MERKPDLAYVQTVPKETDPAMIDWSYVSSSEAVLGLLTRRSPSLTLLERCKC